jgi:hypothetical protein
VSDTGPLELRIAPLLWEAVVVAVRHWLIFATTTIVLGIAFLVDTVLVVHCVLSPACLPTSLFRTMTLPLDEVCWAAYRATSWLVCGLAIQRVLRAEAARHALPVAAGPRKPLHGFGRCVLFLASLSVIGYLAGIPERFLDPDFAYGGVQALWIHLAVYGATGILAVCAWAYLDARFALYMASKAGGGQPLGFAASWQQARPNRRRLFALFIVIEIATYAVHSVVPSSSYLTISLSQYASELERLFGLLHGTLVFRWLAMAEFAVYLAVTNLVSAGAIFAVYRSHVTGSPEMHAQVFD